MDYFKITESHHEAANGLMQLTESSVYLAIN